MPQPRDEAADLRISVFFRDGICTIKVRERGAVTFIERCRDCVTEALDDLIRRVGTATDHGRHS